MKIGRNRHAERFALLRQRPPVGINRQIEFITDPFRRIRRNVEDTDHLGIRTLSVEARMMAAKRSDSDHADLQSGIIFHKVTFLFYDRISEKPDGNIHVFQ